MTKVNLGDLGYLLENKCLENQLINSVNVQPVKLSDLSLSIKNFTLTSTDIKREEVNLNYKKYNRKFSLISSIRTLFRKFNFINEEFEPTEIYM